MTSRISSIVLSIGWAIAAALVLGILIVVADVNEDQWLVAAVLDVGRFFADPFRRIVELDDNDEQIAVNWGIGAVAYVAAAAALASLLGRAHRRGIHD